MYQSHSFVHCIKVRINLVDVETLNLAADASVRSKMEKNGGSWMCSDCGFQETVNMVYKHVEANHVEVTFYCNICHKPHKNRASLLTHKSRNHKSSKIQ